MHIRPARLEDADAIADVLRCSIRKLCRADHGDDPAFLGPWLSNKTPEMVQHALAAPGNRLLVAEYGGEVVGVGLANVPSAGSHSDTVDGVILLNYVTPDARFQGVSKAILAALEKSLKDAGVGTARLTSTKTAHRFYQAAGYADVVTKDRPGDLVMWKPL